MANRLQSLLNARREELQSKIFDLQRELSRATAELEELDRFAETIRMVNRLDTSRQPSATVQPGTIKDFVVQVLRDHPEGLVALDILAAINARFEKTYPRTSLSPQLSRLGQAGILGRKGLVWYLKDSPASPSTTDAG